LRRLAQLQGTLLRKPIRVIKNWHTPSLFCVMAFNNGWEYRNADCCFTIDGDSSTSDDNLMNFTVTPEILWLICMGGEWTYAEVRCALVFKGNSLGASLWVSKKCTVAFAHAGRATRLALIRCLVVNLHNEECIGPCSNIITLSK